MKWYALGFKNAFDFNGRAVRKEFWMFMLINGLLLIAAMIIDNTYDLTPTRLPLGYTFFIFFALILIPSLSVTLRRLHDIGNRGWILLLTLVPVIGVLWILSLLVRDSEKTENIFGASPKADDDIRKSKEFSADSLIIIIVGWMLLCRAYYAIMLRYVPDFYATITFAVSSKFIALIWAAVPICLGFAIRDKYIQFIVFIAGGIYLIYSLYTIIIQMLAAYPIS